MLLSSRSLYWPGPGCRFETVPDAGHAAFWEQPQVWNRFVLEFIAGH